MASTLLQTQTQTQTQTQARILPQELGCSSGVVLSTVGASAGSGSGGMLSDVGWPARGGDCGRGKEHEAMRAEQ
ncbi:hypothetical protein A9R10_03270 [Aeromonas piscicola]|nr:hypothetical protein A9R10_03270 [Aeromonas piscicola]